MSAAVCSHLDTIEFAELPVPIEGCAECLKIGSRWVHLRMCMECGKIGCCDDSPNRHASKHAHEVSHPIIRSTETGEDWSWCFIDNVAFELGRSRSTATRSPETFSTPSASNLLQRRACARPAVGRRDRVHARPRRVGRCRGCSELLLVLVTIRDVTCVDLRGVAGFERENWSTSRK
jgi:hypothetical protein